ncbi:uncharacterized protein VTP21DRAFT_11690 [Calcarisporiella thermophila]|uniref:uncharacterized protein n=1 Tax=Calcarisporiella thermophila TaxID=911321 RepID=UPI0037444B75
MVCAHSITTITLAYLLVLSSAHAAMTPREASLGPKKTAYELDQRAEAGVRLGTEHVSRIRVRAINDNTTGKSTVTQESEPSKGGATKEAKQSKTTEPEKEVAATKDENPRKEQATSKLEKSAKLVDANDDAEKKEGGSTDGSRPEKKGQTIEKVKEVNLEQNSRVQEPEANNSKINTEAVRQSTNEGNDNSGNKKLGAETQSENNERGGISGSKAPKEGTLRGEKPADKILGNGTSDNTKQINAKQENESIESGKKDGLNPSGGKSEDNKSEGGKSESREAAIGDFSDKKPVDGENENRKPGEGKSDNINSGGLKLTEVNVGASLFGLEGKGEKGSDSGKSAEKIVENGNSEENKANKQVASNSKSEEETKGERPKEKEPNNSGPGDTKLVGVNLGVDLGEARKVNEQKSGGDEQDDRKPDDAKPKEPGNSGQGDTKLAGVNLGVELGGVDKVDELKAGERKLDDVKPKEPGNSGPGDTKLAGVNLGVELGGVGSVDEQKSGVEGTGDKKTDDGDRSKEKPVNDKPGEDKKSGEEGLIQVILGAGNPEDKKAGGEGIVKATLDVGNPGGEKPDEQKSEEKKQGEAKPIADNQGEAKPNEGTPPKEKSGVETVAEIKLGDNKPVEVNPVQISQEEVGGDAAPKEGNGEVKANGGQTTSGGDGSDSGDKANQPSKTKGSNEKEPLTSFEPWLPETVQFSPTTTANTAGPTEVSTSSQPASRQLPDAIIPNPHASMPAGSSAVTMKLNIIPYEQVCRDSTLAAQIVNFLPNDLAVGLNVPMSKIVVLSISDATNGGKRRKRAMMKREINLENSDNEGGILVTMAVPKEVVGNLDRVLKDRSSSLYTNPNGKLTQFFDSSFSLVIKDSQDKPPIFVGNNNSATTDSSLRSGQPEAEGVSDNKGLVIGVSVAAAVAAYIGLTAIIITAYKRRRRLRKGGEGEELIAQVSENGTIEISPPLMQENSLGWRTYSGPRK